MSWRYQPPAFSPVTPASLVAGVLAAIRPSREGEEHVIGELCKRYHANDALLTDSGTSALVIAIQMVLPRGGTIAYPAYACPDLVAAALRAGVKVRLYDLDPMTMGPDLSSLRETIARGVDAILVAHLYGYPADVGAVNEVAAERDIPVIEDAAQGAGGDLRGARLGALADLSILSFGRGKGMTAGSGGALLARTPDNAASMRRAASRLRDGSRGAREMVGLSAQWLLARPELYRLPASIPALKLGETVFRRPAEPRSISAAAAAVLPIALSTEDLERGHRVARARAFLAILNEAAAGLVPVRPIPGGQSGFLRLAFLDAIGDTLPNESVGVTRGYPLTLDQHEQLRPILATGESAGKGAQRLRDRLLTVATHSRVGVADVERFARWLSTQASSAHVEAFAT
ncbi:MAG: DegT/DnrJ/EryC1/StrS family aminotransferase [Gemmatimonadaceae bacterium]